MQTEAVGLVRPVHDVLQVLAHELEELLEDLLNLGLLERPHDGRLGRRRVSGRFARSASPGRRREKECALGVRATGPRRRAKPCGCAVATGFRGAPVDSQSSPPLAAAAETKVAREARRSFSPPLGALGGAKRARTLFSRPARHAPDLPPRSRDGGRGTRGRAHHRRRRIQPPRSAGGGSQPGCDALRGQPRPAGEHRRARKIRPQTLRSPPSRSPWGCRSIALTPDFLPPPCTSQVTEEIAWEVFVQAGPVTNVYMPKDRVTNAHQGYAFVEYRAEEDADYVSARARPRSPIFARPARDDGDEEISALPNGFGR